jgi:hypothetical protein
MRLLSGSILLMALLSPIATAQTGGCPMLIVDFKVGTIRNSLADADVVFFGRLENARKKGDVEATDVVILDVIKSHPIIKGCEMVTMARYVENPEPKKPHTFLIFAEIHKNKLEIYQGLQFSDQHMVGYVRVLAKFDSKKPVEVLRYCFDYLEDTNDVIAQDVYRELAQASESERHEAARTLAAAKIRTLLKKEKVEPSRLSLYASLLASCGKPSDADELFAQLKEKGYKQGYFFSILVLNPEQYAPRVKAMAKDIKLPFLTRYPIFRAFEQLHETKAAAMTQEELVQTMVDFLEQDDMADFAIVRLGKWKRWELTKQILSLENRESHKSPVIRKAILVFALQSPLPEAVKYVARQRKRDPEWVADIEDYLKLEATPASAPK